MAILKTTSTGARAPAAYVTALPEGSRHPSRRMVTSSLLMLLAGCSTERPRGPLSTLASRRIVFLEPLYSADLKLNVSPLSAPISAAALAKEEADLNARSFAWRETVVRSFAESFASSLRERNMEAVQVRQEAQPWIQQNAEPMIRSFLTAGFVYKTLNAPSYAPYVQVVLEFLAQGGAVTYHQLYVATDRPFNPFMKILQPTAPYLLPDIGSLSTAPAPALDALAALAAQIGGKFAADLTA